ncbi:hypothetical protein OCH239_22240 [Roseivivax halodurans JCM 10272]|uniref:Uncharacterized protein n=1 Tax=Roseivivax halodurans JCM 10272 TaxID=1449350 RepID=X7E3J1_9RHOB|nr:hypothetical protein OCH239_22240 [Roseivivax halodurans JCM 10272]
MLGIASRLSPGNPWDRVAFAWHSTGVALLVACDAADVA